jgi:MFS family permease
VTPTPERLRRAQPELIAAFLLVGHGTLSSVAWVPEYIDRLGVDFATWGTILGFSTIGAIAPLLIASRLNLRFGSRLVLRVSLYVGMVFLILLGHSDNAIVWTLINTGFTFAMSFAGNAVNTHSVAIQSFVTRPIVSKLHAGWSIGAVLAAITGGLSTVFLSLEIFLVIVAIVTLIAFEIIRPGLLGPDEDGHDADKAVHVKRKPWQLPKQMWLLAAGLVAAVYPEIAVIDWAAVFARDVVNAELSLRALPFAAFMVGMIIGRLAMPFLAERSHPHTVASRGSLIAGIALMASVFISGPISQWSVAVGIAVTMLLWLIVGLGVSGVAPTYFAAAAHIPQISAAWALSRMMLINQLTLIGAKALMGAIAEGVNLSAAFAFPAVLLLIGSVIAAKTTTRAQSDDYGEMSPVTGTITLPVIKLTD